MVTHSINHLTVKRAHNGTYLHRVVAVV